MLVLLWLWLLWLLLVWTLLFKHHQNFTRRHPERQKERNGGGRGKKARNFGAPPFGAPPFGAPKGVCSSVLFFFILFFFFLKKKARRLKHQFWPKSATFGQSRYQPRDRPVSFGNLLDVNSTKTNRDVKQEISICSRIIRLTNNQLKSRKRYNSQKRTESDDKNAVAIVIIVPQSGCVPQDSDALVSQGRQSWGETRCKKSWDQFESTPRQASIREKKGSSLGKISAMRPKQGMKPC